jgi:hypothetical protein
VSVVSEVSSIRDKNIREKLNTDSVDITRKNELPRVKSGGFCYVTHRCLCYFDTHKSNKVTIFVVAHFRVTLLVTKLNLNEGSNNLRNKYT